MDMTKCDKNMKTLTKSHVLFNKTQKCPSFSRTIFSLPQVKLNNRNACNYIIY